ncbi:hypothetical protein BGW80DRAFT_1355689 [Lactifluus volemus]|nr:hypothetical protein BGW80DRAFT_1355689 [Lactifluus volemus]
MSDIPHIPLHHLSSNKSLSQKQTHTSPSRSHPTLLQSFATGPSSVERDGATNLLLAQHTNPLPIAPTSSLSSEPLNDIISPQSQDLIRASVVPDLQYPISPHEVERDPQPTPMDEDTSHYFSHPPIMPSISRPDDLSLGTGVAGGTSDNPTASSPSISSQSTGNDTSTEPKQGCQPVEHLIKLASARDEWLSKFRVTFDHRSGELSTVCTDARHATRVVQDHIGPLKWLARKTCAQAEQMLQEAVKTRNLSDRLMTCIDVLSEDVLGANTHMGRATECSDQMARFVRVEFFDSLATLRTQEKESIVVVETELAEHAAKESAPHYREGLQRRLGYQNAEEQEKESAKQEAAHRRTEEQCEAVKKELYDEQHSGVMAGTPLANEAHAQFNQAERVLDTAGASSGSPVRGSDAPLGVSPLSYQASSQLSAPRTNTEIAASPCNSAEQTIPGCMCFDPPQTEIRPAVNTDLSRSSTNSAPEMHQGNVGEAPQHSCFGQVSREPTHEQVQRDAPGWVAPKQEWQEVEIERGSSVDQVPAERMQSPFLQPLAEVVDTISHQDRQQGITRDALTQDQINDQHARASSTSGSCADSLQATKPEDQQQQHTYMSAPAPSQEEGPIHPQDSLHNRVVPTTDVRAYGRRDSMSSDRSQSPVNERNRRSLGPPSYPRKPRSRSPSPSYPRKRAYFGTPRGTAKPPRSREHWHSAHDWDKRWSHDRDLARSQADSPRHHRPPLSRGTFNTYPSPSPPPSPRPYGPEHSSWRHDLGSRPLVAEHGPQQSVDAHGRESRVEVLRVNANSGRYDPPYEGTKVTRVPEEQQQQQPSSASMGERNRTPTPPPRTGEADISLLGRIDMNNLDVRGHGQGRPSLSVTRGRRRGVRGSSSGSAPPTPPLLSRISEIARPTCMASTLSLSDRMQQD